MHGKELNASCAGHWEFHQSLANIMNGDDTEKDPDSKVHGANMGPI